jgi:hypothetical protein
MARAKTVQTDTLAPTLSSRWLMVSEWLPWCAESGRIIASPDFSHWSPRHVEGWKEGKLSRFGSSYFVLLHRACASLSSARCFWDGAENERN